MIIWIASYPKSGNTFLRSFISSYYFSKKGKFDFDLLLNILQFPSLKFSKKNIYSEDEACKSWIFNQNHFFLDDKVHFVKTHNTLEKFKGNKFTSSKQTLGAIYIVRDPRNLISSLTHHYSLSYDQAYEKIIDQNASLLEKTINNDYSNFTFLGSWSNHYKSWKSNLEFETLFLKYEDFENNKYDTFKNIIKYINRIKGNNQAVDEKKLLTSIKSTNFTNLG